MGTREDGRARTERQILEIGRRHLVTDGAAGLSLRAIARELGVDMERLNVNGGAIAVGHPFGSTGARITTTLIRSLRRLDHSIGLETMCVGGGQGMAMIVERLS